MHQELKQAISQAAKKLFDTDIEPQLTRPEEKFGDYATNAALQLAKKAAATPRKIAQQLMGELQNQPGIQQITIAGPGFINFKLTDDTLVNSALSATNLPKPDTQKEVLVEFGDPNTFKEMHIGHLYSYIAGEAICRLLESTGATVWRLSYHSDIGLNVAKAIWGLQHADKGLDIGKYYAAGHKAYEESPAAKSEIDEINQQVYQKNDPKVNDIYEQGRQASFEEIDKILELLNIPNDKRYLESQSAPVGIEMVKANIGKVFKQSEGAIVYEGEKAGLHTRVFITGKGLPTYDAKDLGLTKLKDKDYPNAERSIIITANEQDEYFKVMLAALGEIDNRLAAMTTHMSHGFVNLSSGKMSSRTGDVHTAMDLILEVKAAVHEQFPDSEARKPMTFAAVKYAFLKHRLGSDITYDINESISLDGSSGPYLQYAHARACSILAKAQDQPAQTNTDLDANERSLARKIGEYPEAVQKAVAELMPHHICTYLYELAQAFNRFYESSRIIGDEREVVRLQLTKAYQQVLASGLGVLNIHAPEKM